MIGIILFASFLVLLFVFFIFYMVTGCLSYKNRYKKNYDYLSCFPFEMSDSDDKNSHINKFACIGLAIIVAGSSFFLIYLNPTFSSLNSLGIVIGIITLFTMASFVGLNYIPAYVFKYHLILSVVFFSLSALLDIVIGLTFFNLYSYLSMNKLAMTLAIICLVIALIKGLILVNPKLSKWTELQSSVGSDGVVTSSRPRPFILAFSEWLTLFLDILSLLVYIIGLLIFSLEIA